MSDKRSGLLADGSSVPRGLRAQHPWGAGQLWQQAWEQTFNQSPGNLGQSCCHAWAMFWEPSDSAPVWGCGASMAGKRRPSGVEQGGTATSTVSEVGTGHPMS